MAKKRIGNNTLDINSRTMAKLNKLHKRMILRRDDESMMGADIIVKNKTSILLKTSDSILPGRDDELPYNARDF
jgi:hypothetical protein